MPSTQPPAPTPLLLTPEQAAHQLGIGRTSLYRLLASGQLESVTIGRLRRIPETSCIQFVERLRALAASTGTAAEGSFGA